MSNKDRFDLEQAIHQCWNVVDDIDDFVWRHFDSSDGPLTEDEQMNILQGISALYRMKFEKLMDTMSQVFEIDEYAPGDQPTVNAFDILNDFPQSIQAVQKGKDILEATKQVVEEKDPYQMIDERERKMFEYLTKHIDRSVDKENRNRA